MPRTPPWSRWPTCSTATIDLAFDHLRIVRDAIERVRVELEVSGIATAFVGPTFTLAELRAVYEAIWGVQLDAANFRRSIVAEDGWVIPTGRRARPGPAGGRPAELYRAGRAWNHGGPIHRLQRTDEKESEPHESRCPRQVRASGRAATRRGRAARPQGRRGPHQDPRHDGQPDGLAGSAQRRAVLSAASSRASADRSGGSSAPSWRERSKPSARPSASSRSVTTSSASSRSVRRTRGVHLRPGERPLAHRAGRDDLRGGGGGLRRGDPRAGVPETGRSSGRGSGSSSTAPPDPSAPRRCSWPSTSTPTSLRCATPRTSSSCDRSEPTEVVDYTQEDFTKNGETYDVIFDAVGKHSFRRCRGSLKPGGIYLATDLGFMSRTPVLALWTARIGDKRVTFPIPRVHEEGRPLPQGAHRGGEVPGGHRPALPVGAGGRGDQVRRDGAEDGQRRPDDRRRPRDVGRAS